MMLNNFFYFQLSLLCCQQNLTFILIANYSFLFLHSISSSLTFFSAFSIYKLNSVGDKLHPCHTPFSIFAKYIYVYNRMKKVWWWPKLTDYSWASKCAFSAADIVRIQWQNHYILRPATWSYYSIIHVW